MSDTLDAPGGGMLTHTAYLAERERLQRVMLEAVGAYCAHCDVISFALDLNPPRREIFLAAGPPDEIRCAIAQAIAEPDNDLWDSVDT